MTTTATTGQKQEKKKKLRGTKLGGDGNGWRLGRQHKKPTYKRVMLRVGPNKNALK
jgi:hypothetical protein